MPILTLKINELYHTCMFSPFTHILHRLLQHILYFHRELSRKNTKKTQGLDAPWPLLTKRIEKFNNESRTIPRLRDAFFLARKL